MGSAKTRSSIRWKITLLVAATTLASLGAFLYAGVGVFIEDKVSYIYDFNFAQTRIVSTMLESRLKEIRDFSESVARMIQPGLTQANRETIKWFYKDRKHALEVDGLAVLRPSGNAFSVKWVLGGSIAQLEARIRKLHWTPKALSENPFLIGQSEGKRLPIGLATFDASGEPVCVLVLLRNELRVLQDLGSSLNFEVIEPSGKAFVEGATPWPADAVSVAQKFYAGLFKSTFPSGVVETTLGQVPYLVSYHRVPGTELIAVGRLSRPAAFEAVDRLFWRSAIQSLGILLMATGIALLLVRGLTRRIRLLWEATQKISQGDFSFRMKEGGSDEVGDLSASFNLMSDRIGELMKETAQKSRMEAELITAQNVQKRFFPSDFPTLPQMNLTGKSLFASECAGDWWNYAVVGDYLILVLGDVTGHGVSSALVTAAAHGAFSVVTQDLRAELEKGAQTPDLGRVISKLNQAVRSASGGGESLMPMVLCAFHLRTGQLFSIRAGHRPGYVYRGGNYIPIKAELTSPLGYSETIQASGLSMQLEPGDMLLWFTDGLLECTNSQGAAINRKDLFKVISEVAERPEAMSGQVSDAVFKTFEGFLGEKAKNPDDDVTVAIGMIPKSAGFLRNAA